MMQQQLLKYPLHVVSSILHPGELPVAKRNKSKTIE
jgi:hypothetical protein